MTSRRALSNFLNDDVDGRPSVTRAIAVTLQGERNLRHTLSWRSFEPTPDLKEQKLLKLELASHAQATHEAAGTAPPQ
jgi:hypothetical protein